MNRILRSKRTWVVIGVVGIAVVLQMDLRTKEEAALEEFKRIMSEDLYHSFDFIEATVTHADDNRIAVKGVIRSHVRRTGSDEPFRWILQDVEREIQKRDGRWRITTSEAADHPSRIPVTESTPPSAPSADPNYTLWLKIKNYLTSFLP